MKMAERPHLARTLDMVELRNDDCPAACKCGGLCSKETQLDVEAQCRGLGDARNGEDHRTVLVDSMRTMQPCEEGPQPLTDGCDMAGWRQHSLVLPCNSQLMEFIHLALNTGSSSTFFRRETQWPVLRFSKASSWEILRVKLSCCPPAQRKAASIDYVAACRAVKNDQVCSSYFSINFECRNMPAKITNAAKCWMALPQYKHQVNNASRSFDDERVRCGDSMSEAGCYENIFCDSEEQEAGWT